MSNNYVIPAATQSIAVARVNWNDSLDALLTNFYSDAAPTTTEFTILGSNPASVSDGVLFRSSSTGSLYIKDSLFSHNNPTYGGNYTRNGIGYVYEPDITALTANIASREVGELICTPSPNARVYMKSTEAGSSYVDIGIPPADSITSTMLKSGSVTESKVGPNVSTLTSSKIFVAKQTFSKTGQIDLYNAAIEARSESGNVIIGLNANANSSAVIVHARGGQGIHITESDGVTPAPINTSELRVNGVPFSPFPVGSVLDYAGNTEPSGWVFCYGQSLDTTTYSELFAVLAYTYGGAGANFNVPDLRGRVVAGKDDMGGTPANRLTGAGGSMQSGDALGNTGGEETHTLTGAESGSPAHQHSKGTLAADSGGSHTHFTNIYSGTEDAGTTYYFTNRTDSPTGPINTGSGGTHGHSISGSTASSASTSASSAHNNMQPTYILNKIIFTNV